MVVSVKVKSHSGEAIIVFELPNDLMELGPIPQTTPYFPESWKKVFRIKTRI